MSLVISARALCAFEFRTNFRDSKKIVIDKLSVLVQTELKIAKLLLRKSLLIGVNLKLLLN